MNFRRISKICLLILFHASFLVWSQSDIYGKIVDEKTKEPVPFVNIGFVEEGIGTTSDENGDFLLEFRRAELDPEAILQISSLGYITKTLPRNELNSFTGKELTVYLEPSDLELDEVFVFNDGKEFIPDKIGYANYGEGNFGYWKDDFALGGELATRILAKDGLRELHKLSFSVKQAPVDSILLRINIYDDDGGIDRLPGTNLNKSGNDIFCKVYNYSERVHVELNPYKIFVEDDFIVSLELVKNYGKSAPEFALEAASHGFGSYRKYTSQDKWVKFSITNMAYELETSLLVSRRLAKKFEKASLKMEEKKRKVSGFTIASGKMIPNVEVKNLRTSEKTMTDKSGRYVIHARKGDVLVFTKEGFDKSGYKASSKTNMNVQMKRALELINPATPPN